MTTTASAGGWSVRVEIERHGADLEVPEHPHFAQLTYRGAPIGVLQRRHHRKVLQPIVKRVVVDVMNLMGRVP